MEINEKIHGFVVNRKRAVKEIDAAMYEMTFEKNGAKLIFLERADVNKTFAITFRTTPEDDTGVFHILEHSVLCGSEKFPLKEPFVDLLKSSMQTFLNAMTFLDKTMYPVSSRNNKDFLNLIDVYMDAVLHPLIYKKKEIFMQEGWHIEQNGSDLSYNGVVYNEMKGALSSVEGRMPYEVLKRLFPDTCYGYCSGGDPEDIIKLTYEKFIGAHERFYHPSNATIFLDGEVDLESTLSLIESYLKDFDKKEVNTQVETQKAVKIPACVVPYSADEEDGVFGTTEISKGYVTATYDEREKIFALSILQNLLCATNESPLKKALLSKGLAKEVYFDVSDDTKQHVQFLTVRGVKDENRAETEQVITDVLTELCKNGIDKKELTAVFNSFEFAVREHNYGGEPDGLIYAMKVEETALYGGDPLDALVYDDIFDSLRAKMNTGYFENLIKEAFLENEHTATVYMVPDKNLARDRAQKTQKDLNALFEEMTEEQKRILKEENARLDAFQATPDTPEMSALIPHIELSDISERGEKLPLEVRENKGVTVLYSDVNTNGIVYADLFFSLAALSKEELQNASVLSDVLTNTATEKHTARESLNEIMTYLGNFSCSIYTAPKIEDDTCTPYFHVKISALEKNKEKLLSILHEVLTQSIFDEKTASDIIAQRKLAYENSLKERGNRHAITETMAYFTQKGAVDEFTAGRSFYEYICAQTDMSSLCLKLKTLCEKIFIKDRLTLSMTGKDDEDLQKKLASMFKETGEEINAIKYPLYENKERFIPITSDVFYAAKGINVRALGKQMTGQLQVAASILSLDYLWNEVRVKGGAYGCSCVARQSGDLAIASYRDPKGRQTLSVYDTCADALKSFAQKEDDITKYIIGTISNTEPVLTSHAKGVTAAANFLNGITYEDLCESRKQILSTTPQSITECAQMFTLLKDEGAVCIVGPKEK